MDPAWRLCGFECVCVCASSNWWQAGKAGKAPLSRVCPAPRHRQSPVARRPHNENTTTRSRSLTFGIARLQIPRVLAMDGIGQALRGPDPGVEADGPDRGRR